MCSIFFLDIPLDVALDRLTQRALDPITGDRFHAHEHPAPNQNIKQRLASHPTDAHDLVQRNYQTYSVYFDELQDFYSDYHAIHVPADQDAYTVFEAVEAGIVNQLHRDEN